MIPHRQFRSASARASIVIFSICSRGRCHDKIVLKMLPSSPPQPVELLHPSAAFFFSLSVCRRQRTALRSQTLSIPVIFFTKRGRRKFPSAVSSSSAEKVRYCQPYFPPAAEIPRLLRFQINTCRLSDCFWEIPAAAKVPQEPFLQSGRPVYSSYSRYRR